MMTYGLKYIFIKVLFRIIYLCISISSYQQLAFFSQGKSKHIYKKSKTTALLKYYYLIGLPIAIYNQRSAVSGQRSAVSDHSYRSLCHAQLSFAMLMSSNITAPAVVSAIATASAVIITALLSYMILPLEF